MRFAPTEINTLFADIKQRGFPVAAMPVAAPDDVWRAIRHFFNDEVGATA